MESGAERGRGEELAWEAKALWPSVRAALIESLSDLGFERSLRAWGAAESAGLGDWARSSLPWQAEAFLHGKRREGGLSGRFGMRALFFDEMGAAWGPELVSEIARQLARLIEGATRARGWSFPGEEGRDGPWEWADAALTLLELGGTPKSGYHGAAQDVKSLAKVKALRKGAGPLGRGEAEALRLALAKALRAMEPEELRSADRHLFSANGRNGSRQSFLAEALAIEESRALARAVGAKGGPGAKAPARRKGATPRI